MISKALSIGIIRSNAGRTVIEAATTPLLEVEPRTKGHFTSRCLQRIAGNQI